jgi:hypothetical protein
MDLILWGSTKPVISNNDTIELKFYVFVYIKYTYMFTLRKWKVELPQEQ